MTKEDKLEKLRYWCGCQDHDCDVCMFTKDGDKAWCWNDEYDGRDAPEELFDDALKRIEASNETKPSGTSLATAVEKVVNDMINHPNHYTHGGMECIDEMVILFGTTAVMNFCLCNAWKYRKRAMYKNGQEDMDKSDWYIAKYKELMDDADHYIP